MTSWYSNILTKTTSQISSLRSTLLSSDNDGDTEDDTHVCRVLRNFYTDKGRPLPGWLPADPKAGAGVAQPLYAASQAGSRYGVGVNGQGSTGGGLSSLWDSAPSQQGLSLRAGREEVQGRPLAGPRRGSYNHQNQNQNQNQSHGSGVGAAAAAAAAAQGSVGGPLLSSSSSASASAQDRLKQRLWGVARQPSPLQAGGQFLPPGSGTGTGTATGRASFDDRAAALPSGSHAGGVGGSGAAGGQRRQGLPSGPRGYR